jgi:hypothetical protein
VKQIQRQQPLPLNPVEECRVTSGDVYLGRDGIRQSQFAFVNLGFGSIEWCASQSELVTKSSKYF